jgi:hypothetical protein
MRDSNPRLPPCKGGSNLFPVVHCTSLSMLSRLCPDQNISPKCPILPSKPSLEPSVCRACGTGKLVKTVERKSKMLQKARTGRRMSRTTFGHFTSGFKAPEPSYVAMSDGGTLYPHSVRRDSRNASMVVQVTACLKSSRRASMFSRPCMASVMSSDTVPN